MAARLPLLWQHDPRDPIGAILWAREDKRGLMVRAQVLPSLRRGAEALALMRAGVLDGLSIGFHARIADRDAHGHRLLVEVDLVEISVVTFPMQRLARIHRLDPRTPTPALHAPDDDALWAGIGADITSLAQSLAEFSNREDRP